MYLGFRNRQATVAEVAKFYGISASHVAKVVNRLSRLGYVRAIRGARGGILLGRPATEIRIGEVIEAFEGNLHLLDCVGTSDVCAVQRFCKLLGVLAEAGRLQTDYLNSVTLSDVLPGERDVTEYVDQATSS